MSSIRLFVLDALAERGPMHGHQLRLLAEEEHVHLWTDISVGALYGVLRRMASEALIRGIRTERSGCYPERQVYSITETGEESLAVLRDEGLREVIVKPDPFDLAMTRLDGARLDSLPQTIAERVDTLSAMLVAAEAATAAADPYLTVSERFVMKHKADRLRAEILWHNALLATLPDIISDESARKERS